MNVRLSRRSFLRQSPLAVAALGLLSGVSPRAGATVRKLPFMISLGEWSLHRTLAEKKLDHRDFPRVARADYGLDAIELVNQFFSDKARERPYLADFKRRADDQGVRILLIMVDGEGALGDPDSAKRKQAVENHYKWVEAAKLLSCHSIRVNAETQGVGTPEEQSNRAADGLRRLAEYGAKHGLNILVENHGRLSSNGAWLAGVMKKVNLPNCGTLPDFGNFQIGENETYDRYQGVAEMMPFARAVSAKSHDFDAQGNEVHTDYRRMLKIVTGAGYHGYVGIEYEGDRLSEPDGIRATKRLLEKVRAEMEATPTPVRS